MGQTPNDIEHEIERARSRLGQDLNELEYRVKSTFDWRRQLDRAKSQARVRWDVVKDEARSRFERNPFAFIGAAFGAALALGWLSFRRSRSEPKRFVAYDGNKEWECKLVSKR